MIKVKRAFSVGIGILILGFCIPDVLVDWTEHLEYQEELHAEACASEEEARAELEEMARRCGRRVELVLISSEVGR